MPATRSSRSQPAVALASVPAVAAVLLLGVWVAGGVISDDYRTSMGLTAAWFLLSGAACLALARRTRRLRVAVLATYVLMRARSAPTSPPRRSRTVWWTSRS